MESNRTSRLILPFDNTAGFVTGVALVNLATEAVILNATIRDDTGAQAVCRAVALPAMGHTSFAVPDWQQARNHRVSEYGRRSNNRPGLRFSASSFTSIPVVLPVTVAA